MKIKNRSFSCSSAAVTLLLILAASTAGAWQYDYGNPTAYEQLHLEAINRARANPAAEAAAFGIELNEGVDGSTISRTAKQPLAMNSALLAAARGHSADMLANNYFDHYSMDGSSPFDRMREEGYSFFTAGENIGFMAHYPDKLDMSYVALKLHRNLFVDEDIPGRGHRVNILNPDFREIGVGLLHGDYYDSGEYYPHAYMLTCDFGARNGLPPIVTGVVYEDRDNDGTYDAGEGIGNVSIYVEETAEMSRTATAGGYGIPLSRGTYHLRFVHNPLGEVKKTVSLKSENIKLDVLASEFGSAAASLELQVNINRVHAGSHLVMQVSNTIEGDLYVFAILPSGHFFCLAGPNRLAALDTLARFPHEGGTALDFVWPYAPESAGTYILGAGVVKNGRDPLDPDNWITWKISEVDVSF